MNDDAYCTAIHRLLNVIANLIYSLANAVCTKIFEGHKFCKRQKEFFSLLFADHQIEYLVLP